MVFTEKEMEEIKCIRAALERILMTLNHSSYVDYQMEKWGKIIKDKERIHQEMKETYFMPDGKTPRCAICGESMKQVSQYEWELDCKCAKENPSLKNLRLSIG